MFPVVHPVPDPAAQTCFSAGPPNTSEPKEPSSPLSSSESEKNEQSSSSHSDSFTSSSKARSPHSSSYIEQSHNVVTNVETINIVENEKQRANGTGLKPTKRDPTKVTGFLAILHKHICFKRKLLKIIVLA